MENDLLIDIKCLKEFYKHFKTYYLKKWILSPQEDYINICQSCSSIPLILQTLFYKDPTSHFF